MSFEKNRDSLHFLRQTFSAHEAKTDEIAAAMMFFINVMQRIDSFPEERVLAAIFFQSLGSRLDLLFDITEITGMEDLRIKIADFDILRELFRKNTSKTPEIISTFIQRETTPQGLTSIIEKTMMDSKMSIPVAKMQELKKNIWNTALRDIVRSRLVKQRAA